MTWGIWLSTAVMLFGLTACATQTLQAIPTETTWQWRMTGTPAATGAEQIAVEVVRKGRKPVQWGGAKAYFEQQEKGFDTVTVEIVSRSMPGFVKKVQYQVRDQLIHAESYPNYIPVVDRTRESYAREVALLAYSGHSVDRPAIYERKYLYKPIPEDSCSMKVTEYDIDFRPLGTYQFNLCDQ